MTATPKPEANAPVSVHWSVRTVASPVGELTLVASVEGVCAVLWSAEGEQARTGIALDDAAEEKSNKGASRIVDDAARQLEEYFDGERTGFELPLAPTGTDFQRAAWLVLREIDFGTTISYGEQARRLGNPNAARAVGAANGKNPISIIVPCHRVVGSDGSLTGFAGGSEAKRWLLDHETSIAGRRIV